MNQKILAILVLCILFTGLAYSQDRPHKHRTVDKKLSAEEMTKTEMKMLKQELELTETQVTFVQKILEDSNKKMEEQFKSDNKDKEVIENILKEKDDNLKRVLTDEQWTKYQDIKDNMKNKNKRGDGPPDRQKPREDEN